MAEDKRTIVILIRVRKQGFVMFPLFFCFMPDIRSQERNSHVKYVLSQAGKRLGMLGRIRGNLTSDCANSIYTAYIRPIMDYCDTMWNCCAVGNSSSQERLQRRAAKIVS